MTNKLNGYPKGISLVVEDAPRNWEEKKWYKGESFQLANGKFANMEFFIPDDTNYSGEYYWDRAGRYSYDSDPNLGHFCICSLQGFARYNKEGYSTSIYHPNSGEPYAVVVPVKMDYANQLKEKKGRQYLVIELKSYGDWMKALDLEDVLEVKYTSPWFHNAPYTKNHLEDLNYLRAKIVEVK